MESIKQLRGICQKRTYLYNKKGEENQSPKARGYIFDNFLNVFSIYFTKIFLILNMNANQVSVLSMFMGLIAGILFSFAPIWFWIGGLIFVQLFHFLDASDGEVARYRKEASPIGKFFDLIAHSVVIAAFFIGITIGTFSSLNNPWVFVFGLICVASALLAPLITALSSSLIFHYGLLEDDKKINKIVKSEFSLKPKEITWRYTLRRFLGFDGLPFMALIAAFLDWLFYPLAIPGTAFYLNFRFLFIIIAAIVSIITVVKKMIAVAKSKQKYF